MWCMDPNDETGCVTFLVRHAWLSMRSALAVALDEHGLSVQQYGTLLCVRESPGLTVAEVGRVVGTTRQSANELVTGMERAGLDSLLEDAIAAIRAGANQYAPARGVPTLRQAIADHQKRFYELSYDPD